MTITIPKQITLAGVTMHVGMMRKWLATLGIIIVSEEDHTTFTVSLDPSITELIGTDIFVRGFRRAILYDNANQPPFGFPAALPWCIPIPRYTFTKANTGYRITDKYLRQSYQYSDWKRRFGRVPANKHIAPNKQLTAAGQFYNIMSWPDVQKLRLDINI